MNKKLLICVIVIAIVASAVAIGISRKSDNQEPGDTAQISNLQTFMRNESYGVGDGYMSGSISNPTDKVRDYEIAIQRWAPKYGYGSDSPYEFQETVAKFTVTNVKPGEQQSWECLLFTNRGFKNLNWQWRVCVDGWCWIR